MRETLINHQETLIFFKIFQNHFSKWFPKVSIKVSVDLWNTVLTTMRETLINLRELFHLKTENPSEKRLFYIGFFPINFHLTGGRQLHQVIQKFSTEVHKLSLRVRKDLQKLSFFTESFRLEDPWKAWSTVWTNLLDKFCLKPENQLKIVQNVPKKFSSSFLLDFYKALLITVPISYLEIFRKIFVHNLRIKTGTVCFSRRKCHWNHPLNTQSVVLTTLAEIFLQKIRNSIYFGFVKCLTIFFWTGKRLFRQQLENFRQRSESLTVKNLGFTYGIKLLFTENTFLNNVSSDLRYAFLRAVPKFFNETSEKTQFKKWKQQQK